MTLKPECFDLRGNGGKFIRRPKQALGPVALFVNGCGSFRATPWEKAAFFQKDVLMVAPPSTAAFWK
jgi:hypothetical protein